MGDSAGSPVLRRSGFSFSHVFTENRLSFKCTWVSEFSVALSSLDTCVLTLCCDAFARAWSDFPNGVGSKAVTQIMESGWLGLRHGLCKWQLNKAYKETPSSVPTISNKREIGLLLLRMLHFIL